MTNYHLYGLEYVRCSVCGEYTRAAFRITYLKRGKMNTMLGHWDCIPKASYVVSYWKLGKGE